MNLIWTPAQLAMLAKVVDLNGFSAAARALAVPKAAVSRAVADLEKALGVRVLERTTRRVALTAAGRLVYPHARRVGEEADAARAAIGNLQSPQGRPLRVAADPTYGRVLLSPSCRASSRRLRRCRSRSHWMRSSSRRARGTWRSARVRQWMPP